MSTRLLSSLMHCLLPMRTWWPRVGRESLRADLVAGLTGMVIVVPQAVAYASIAGLPPAYGLYTAIVPVIVSALFGSSWHLVSGPTAALSIVVYSTLEPMAETGSAEYVRLAITLSFMTGAVMLLMGLARLGGLVNFVSHTVVVGFTAGAAVLIGASQLKNFSGLAVNASASFIGTLSAFVGGLAQVRPGALAVGSFTLVLCVLVRWRWQRLPHMIIGMLGGSAFAAALQAGAGHDLGIATVAAIPRSLPPLSLPALSTETLRSLLPATLALAMLSLTEAIAIARAVALKSGQRIDSTQEFIGQGLGNLLGSFASSYVSSGSFTRSGLNYSAGARTPLAAVSAALFLIVTLFALAPLVRFLPIASMAAVLLMVAWSLIDGHHIRSILRTSRAESAVLIATFAATLLVELEFAIYVGVLLSLLLFLDRTSRPTLRPAMPSTGIHDYHFVPRGDGAGCPQLEALFVDGPVYFGAADHMQQRLREVDAQRPARKHLLLLAPGIGFIDSSGAEMLGQEARRRNALGGGLYFHRLQAGPQAVLERSGQLEHIGREHLFEIGVDVVAAVLPRLDPAVCSDCQARVFRCCPPRPSRPGAGP